MIELRDTELLPGDLLLRWKRSANTADINEFVVYIDHENKLFYVIDAFSGDVRPYSFNRQQTYLALRMEAL